jgi:hypothetical protein
MPSLRRRHPEQAADKPPAPVEVIGSAEDLSAFDDSSLDFRDRQPPARAHRVPRDRG